jgi:hypothetical protein
MMRNDLPSGGGFSVGRFLAGGIPVGAAVGQATPNATYVGRRLAYEKQPEGSLDPLANNRYVVYLLRQAGIFIAIYWGLAFFFLIVLGGFSLLTRSTVFIGLWAAAAELTPWAFLIAFLLIPIPVVLSEWKFLVDDKGAARPIVFEHVTYAFRRRNTPVDSIGVRRLSLPGGITRDYLEITRGVFSGYISCFEEGNDLYVGWTFWLRMSPLKFILLRVQRLWHEITQKANELYVTLRYESAKSMREAMHSAAREGIDVAAGQLEAEGHGIVATLQVSTSTVGGA